MPTKRHPWNPPEGRRPHGHSVSTASVYEDLADTSRKAYATVSLSFHPHASGFTFDVGAEVQGILPADVLKACVARGEVSYDKPEVTL